MQQREQVCPTICTWDPPTNATANDLDDRGHSAYRWSVVSYVVGGAAIAAGVTMVVLGHDARTTPTIAVAPQPGGAFVLTQLAF